MVLRMEVYVEAHQSPWSELVQWVQSVWPRSSVVLFSFNMTASRTGCSVAEPPHGGSVHSRPRGDY